MEVERSEEVERLLSAGADRDSVLGDLLEAHRVRLRRMVDIRMDPRLHHRVDASDIEQDAFVEISQRLDVYLRDPGMPFHLWIRFITGQRLLLTHRHHLGTQKRDAGLQVSLGTPVPGASSVVLADQLMATGTTPTGAVARNETRSRLVEALESMTTVDREVLVLRHFEQFSNAETAQALGLGETAASNRYVRALKRLRDVLGGGVLDERTGPEPES